MSQERLTRWILEAETTSRAIGESSRRKWLDNINSFSWSCFRNPTGKCYEGCFWEGPMEEVHEGSFPYNLLKKDGSGFDLSIVSMKLFTNLLTIDYITPKFCLWNGKCWVAQPVIAQWQEYHKRDLISNVSSQLLLLWCLYLKMR